MDHYEVLRYFFLLVLLFTIFGLERIVSVLLDLPFYNVLQKDVKPQCRNEMKYLSRTEA